MLSGRKLQRRKNLSKLQPSIWEDERLTMQRSIELTIESLYAYGLRYKHWAIAYSGGKDSSAVVTLVSYLIATGQIPAPESLTVIYADTGMELPPLQAVALQLLSTLEKRGIKTQIVLPALDERFYVYMFGRGVPPPKNRFRWCTAQLKIEPMENALSGLRAEIGEKLLMLTGVRLGESSARDQRIVTSCSRDGAECGQGWLQTSTPGSVADILAPILHWRVCHVWDWLTFQAPAYGFPTAMIAEIYGGDEKEEINARTGCVGCNLASKDVALDTLLKHEQWSYFAPLKRLKPLYQELATDQYRLQKDGTQRRKDGSIPKNLYRKGPLTMEARRYGLALVKSIQDEVNAQRPQGMPEMILISLEEESRILELINANTWPNGWDGTEPRASEFEEPKDFSQLSFGLEEV
jgi:DNA sulfur modification protein DndC